MRCADWGERSPRWAGIRSEVVDVRGRDVHVLRADSAGTTPGGWPQLLVHPMGGSGSYWLDVLRPLTAYGPVLAPDLPGTVTGHTELPRRNAARADSNARFLRALSAALGLDQVVVHGWSTGGLTALLFADLEPARVQRLVLVDPTLLSADMAALLTQELAGIRMRPRRLSGAVTAFADTVSAMYVDRRPVEEAIARVPAPTLLLWGDRDPVIDRRVIGHVSTRRPDWDLHVFEAVGHLPPMVVPETYVDVVGRWLMADPR